MISHYIYRKVSKNIHYSTIVRRSLLCHLPISTETPFYHSHVHGSRSRTATRDESGRPPPRWNYSAEMDKIFCSFWCHRPLPRHVQCQNVLLYFRIAYRRQPKKAGIARTRARKCNGQWMNDRKAFRWKRVNGTTVNTIQELNGECYWKRFLTSTV